MGTNNQNCRYYTSIHLVSEILLFSCLMPSEHVLAISWWEQVIIWWDGVCFVVDQHD